MATAWKRVYIFVSSTFNDMHAERDYLVKRVFPQLREWCEKRKLRLVDIDLRWGVTEDDATRNRNVVKTCLARIDQCRPFFLCFLGQRRGWVPERNDIANETFAAYPELDAEAGKASITEMEILHAIVRPLHGNAARDPNHPEHYEPAKHAFFYLREPNYLAQLPGEPEMLRHTYTNEWIDNPTLRAEADRELERWRDVEIPRTQRPIRRYVAHWSPAARTPELALPLQCPASNENNIERWREQWQRVGIHVTGVEVQADPVEANKARRFNEKLSAGRLTNFTCEGLSLSSVILRDIQEGITARYPEHTDDTDATPLQKELDQQEEFLGSNSEGFIERAGAFADLDAYVDGDSRQLFVLTAEGGMGKSMLLANWIDRRRDRCCDVVAYRFIGQSEGSSSVPNLLRSLLLELQEVHGRIPKSTHKSGAENDGPEQTEEVPLQIPLDPVEIQNFWQTNLSDFGKEEKIVFVIDALNQLETGLKRLDWLPLNGLPENVKVVVSFRLGADGSQELLNRWANTPNVCLAEVKPFEDCDDRRALVKQYLDQYLKQLDEKHIETLINSEGARNPLYLKVVLSELRVFGAFAQLGEKIRSDFGTTPVSAFQAVLRRLERDPVYTAIDPQQAVPLLFGLLAHARRGLELDELVGLFAMQLNDSPNEQLVRDGLHLFLRQVDPFLARRDNRYDFFYESFKTAVSERYTLISGNDLPMARAKRQWHGALVDYFEKQPYFLETAATSRSVADTKLSITRRANVRKVDELPWQMVAVVEQNDAGTEATTAQRDWVRLETLLTDLHFVEAKSAARFVFEMLEDYRSALDALPEARAELKEQERRAARAARWTVEIIEYSRKCNAGERPPLPEIIPSVELWSDERIEAECQRIIENPTRLDRLRAFETFVNSECYPLLAFGRRDGFVVQHAFNYAPLGSVNASARAQIANAELPLLLRVWPPGAKHNPKTALLATLEGHTSSVNGVSVTPDGTCAVSAGYDNTLRVWNLETGHCLRTLEGHRYALSGVSVTPDGTRSVSASGDNTLRLWDLETGCCLRKLAGHTSSVEGVSVTPDGMRAVSASSDNSLRVWDLETGHCLGTLEGHSDSVRGVSVTPDSTRAVSASSDHTLRVWDLDTGRCLRTLAGHTWEVCGVSITPDGMRAVSAGYDDTLRVWDLETGHCLKLLAGHTSSVRGVSVTPDGTCAVSAGGDDTVRVWDLETGRCLRGIEGHASSVEGVSVTPDGARMVSASLDKTLRVWDLKTGHCLRTLEGHTASVNDVRVTPDGTCAVSASSDSTLRVWDLRTGHCLRTLVGHNGWVERVSVTPDGTRTVSAGWDHSLRVWDLDTGQCQRTLEGHTGSVNDVRVTPDGTRAVSSGSYDKTLRVWELETGLCLRTLAGHTNTVYCVSVTPDGSRAVSASSDHTLRVWDLKTGHCLRTLEGHTASVNDVRVTPDGTCAVSASSDSTLRVWDLRTGHCLRTLEGHTKTVAGVIVTLDVTHAVSAGWDNTLRVWDLQTGQAVAVISIRALATVVVLSTYIARRGDSARTSTICAGLSTGEVIFLDTSRVIRPLT